MTTFVQSVLLCYRGRYHDQVEALAGKLRARGLSVSYDREILVEPSGEALPDVEWVNLGTDTPSGSTTWRAPLKQAIEASEVVVFLVDPVDQSINVINEVSWVAKAGKHAFFVLDTRAESVSAETEGIFVGSLNLLFAMALRRWEVPGVEHVLFAHEDPTELDSRLDVLVNRIEEYLERVRHQPVPVVRFADGGTLRDIQDLPLVRARRRLLAVQEGVHKRLGLKGPRHTQDSYQEALNYAFQFEQGAVVEGDLIRSPGSPFRYPVASERRRFLRTQRIVERVRPGEYEKHPLFTLLARQAASVELLLEGATPGKQFNPPVLLGTLPQTALDDVVSIGVDKDFAIIFVDAAFADFVYQITKVSVCSWKLLSAADQLPARFSPQTADVAEVLAADPTLEDAFLRCLMSYAVRGFPGESIEGAPPRAYEAPLSRLTEIAERFMVGRGYAQLALVDPTFPGPSLAAVLDSERDRTLATDNLAAVYALSSAMMFDRTDPAMALQGCGMPVVCADLIHRAVATLDPSTRSFVERTQPTLEERLAVLENACVVAAELAGATPERARDSLKPAHLAWQTPQLLWNRVEHRLAEERKRGATPASIWR